MIEKGNLVAAIALWGMVLSSLLLLVVKSPEKTAITLAVAAFLFLPSGPGIKLPTIPILDKNALPYLCLLFVYVIRRGRWVGKNKLGRGADLLMILAMLCAFATAFTNTEVVPFAKYRPEKVGPAMSIKDAIEFVRTDLVQLFFPFLLGRLVIREQAHAVHLLKAFAIGGLIYTLPILFELRMSPQLHLWIYGQTPREGDFAQLIRGDGFRPIVFMPHALPLAIFMCLAVLSGATLARARQRLMGISWRPFVIFLMVVLVACKSWAAIIYMVALTPLVFIARPKRQLRVALLLAGLFLVYPLLRGFDLFPTDTLLDLAGRFDEERKISLQTRFDSEQMLLDKTQKKLAFGWGGFGRPSIYDDWGKEISIYDGYWITQLSHRGAVYLVLVSLLLAWPILNLRKRLAKVPDNQDRLYLAGFAIMLGISLVDLLPNGLLLNYPFFLAGALLGYTRVLLAEVRARERGWSVPRVSAPGEERTVPGLTPGTAVEPRV